MKRISDRTFRGTTETNDSFKSYQKNNPLVARIVGKAKARKASNAASMEQKIATKKKKKPHDEDDNDNDVDDVNNEQGLQEQGHEMTPIRKTKRMDVTTIKSNKPIYGPIQEETPGIPEQVVEISIEDAIERLGSGPFQRRILIAAGLCFAADSMEILLLSFLAVVLQAEWDLTAEETASITSSVFAGALIGTLILGPLADRIGRKPVFTITAAIICVFGFATAAATNFGVLLLFRFFVGIGVGGLTVPFDTLAEFVPSSERGTSLLKIEYFWTGGTLLVPVLAYFSLSEGDDSTPNGWRLFVVLCGLPCLVSTLLGIVYVPESPRWLMTKGKHGKALGILRDAARRNGKNPMELFPEHARLVDDGEKEGAHCNFCELLAPQWRRITLTLWGTWAGAYSTLRISHNRGTNVIARVDSHSLLFIFHLVVRTRVCILRRYHYRDTGLRVGERRGPRHGWCRVVFIRLRSHLCQRFRRNRRNDLDNLAGGPSWPCNFAIPFVLGRWMCHPDTLLAGKQRRR